MNFYELPDDGTIKSVPPELTRYIASDRLDADGKLLHPIEPYWTTPLALARHFYSLDWTREDEPVVHAHPEPKTPRAKRPTAPPRIIAPLPTRASVAQPIVYFIGGDVGPIKIGMTASAANRLARIQSTCPFPVRVLASMPGGRSEEMRLHRQFAASRLHGEWFERSPELLAEIAALAPTSPPARQGEGV